MTKPQAPERRFSGDPRPRLDAPLAGPASSARIFDRFLAACRERPDAPAVAHASGTWTYAQLERATRALAVQLLAQPADSDVVALHARRCPELPIAMLACLRAGLTFAVLDAGYPADRLEQLRALLAPGRSLTVDAAMMTGLFDADLADLNDDRIDQVSANSIAYLLFTSGTTGVPKCIATAHAPLVHFVDWYAAAFAVDGESRFSMLSGLGHDPVLRDIFVPLSLGAQLHVPEQEAVFDPAKLHAWLSQARITHAHVTPQLCRILCAGRSDHPPLSALRFVLSGGDSLRTRQANEVLAAAPGARVVNFYGATETPQAMAYHVFDPREDTGDAVPVGVGIADVQLAVLDEALELAPVGVRGQLAIRTRFLSAGYLGDAALTNHKFVANPHTEDPGDRVYLTGDIGRCRDDGAVVIDGRMDDQVKIRGFRVELGDVAHQLQRIATVKEAVVLAERAHDGERRLVAYLVAPPGGATGMPATAAVRDAIAATAPAYMVPARCIWLPQFPLLPNGKIDRAMLARLEVVEDSAPPPEPDNAIEATIVSQWKEILGHKGIDVDASFVDLGGDSLSFIEASVQVERLLGRLPDRWERMSIRELARQVQAKRTWWTRVDASVLLRAISIVLVVVGHFELPDPPGSVRALFVVSGMSFGKYLVPQVLRSGRATPILRLVAKIAVPAVIYTVVINVVFHHPKWPGLLMITNLVSHDQNVGGLGFWFIDVLVQSLAILALALSIPRVRERVSIDPFGCALGATVVFAAIVAVAPHIFDTSYLYDRVPYYHLGAICLGWAIVHADTLPRKLLVVAATVLTFGTLNTELLFVFPFAATFALIAWQRVPLPIFVGRVVHVVAAASLFIYLTDHQSALVLGRLGVHPVVGVAIAVAVGIATRKAWETAASAAVRRFYGNSGA